MVEVILVVLFAADPGPASSERFEFAFQRDLGDELGLHLSGPNARQFAKTDGKGLRVTLPAERSDRGSVGVETRFHVRGDFEITMGYEILAVDEQAPADGAGASLWLKFANSTAGGASVTRLRKGTKEVFGASRITVGRDGKDRYQTRNVPAESKRGKLRLVRTGSTLRYLVAEPEGEFREIHSAEVGIEDVTNLRALATTAGKPASVDVRLVDWSIAAESLPNPPAIAPRSGNGWGWLVWTVGLVLLAGLGTGTVCYFVPAARRLPWRKVNERSDAGQQPSARTDPKKRPGSARQK